MRHRRRRANPSTTTILVIGGGVALLGVAAYFLLKPTSSTTAAVAPGPGPAPQLPAGRPLGDPSDTSSVAYACNVAWRLTALGHPAQAAVWAAKCTAGGGTIPANASQQYT